MIKLILTNTVKDRYYIYLDREVVGVIEYIDYGDEIEIKYIKIHKEYIDAGANIITANTFSANCLKYPKNYKKII